MARLERIRDHLMPHNPNCPACQTGRFHTPEEWRLHAGEGRQGISENIPVKRSGSLKDESGGIGVPAEVPKPQIGDPSPGVGVPGERP
jgi:hypothetical protein